MVCTSLVVNFTRSSLHREKFCTVLYKEILLIKSSLITSNITKCCLISDMFICVCKTFSSPYVPPGRVNLKLEPDLDPEPEQLSEHGARDIHNTM